MTEVSTHNKKPAGTKLSRFINETRNCYSCLLPSNLGGFLLPLIELYHSRIKFDTAEVAKLEALHKDAIYIYVTKYRSRFSFLFAYIRFKKLGLPFPTLGLDFNMLLWQPVGDVFKFVIASIISLVTKLRWRDPYASGFIKRQLLKGRTAILPLVSEKSFKRRFIKQKTDPLQYLIELQKETGKKIYLIPILPILTKMPNRNQRDLLHPIMANDKPRNIFARILPIISGKAFFEVATPVRLKAFCEEHSDKTAAEQAILVRAQMTEDVNLHRQGITGPAAKSRQEIKEQILTSEHFMDYMKSYAETKKTSIAKVHKSAEEYIEEIAANLNFTAARLLYYILHAILKIMFEGIVINKDGLDAAKEASRKGPIIFIPCHRSHVDYLVLSYTYYRNDLSIPLIAAGKNLSFWPMGPIFRSCGAFFIRRSFQGAVLYANVFSEYIYTVLKEGYNLEQFIEGGRSRTGKLLSPKLGMLTILLNTIREKHTEDLTIVPIFIGYDRVVEEKAYLNEVRGGTKRPERFSGVLRATSFLTRKHGTIYIQMAKPLSVRALAATQAVDMVNAEPRDFNNFVGFVGNKIMSEINHETITTPYGVTASAILNERKSIMAYGEIKTTVELYLRYLKLTRAPVAESLLTSVEASLNSAILAYADRKFIVPVVPDQKKPDKKTQQAALLNLTTAEFDIKYATRPDLDYYRNNCITAFIPLAFASMAILEQAKEGFTQNDLAETYFYLKNLFRVEFIRDIDSDSEGRLAQALDFLKTEGLIIENNGQYSISQSEKANEVPRLRSCASFILPVLETYFVTLSFLSTRQKETKAKNDIKKIVNLGEKMLNDHLIECREALSKITIENAVNVFAENKLINASQIAEITPVLTKLENLVKTLH